MVDRTPLLVVSLLFVLAPASGSLVEDATGGAVSYQFDDDGHHDAPDTCGDATEDHALFLGERTDGLLVPVEDEADHFLLTVNASTVGERVRVDAVPAQAGNDVRVDVSVPGCQGSVLDAINQPVLIEDPSPGEGQKLAVAQDGTPVCSDRWFWVLNQVDADDLPQTIHVTWTDGSQEDLPAVHVPAERVAHYATTTHPDVTVLRATAVVDDDWTGRFIITEQFCNAEDGGAVFGEPAVRVSDTILEFTPLGAGQHIISVVFLAREPEVPTAIPANCHYCVDGLDELVGRMSYDLGSGPT